MAAPKKPAATPAGKPGLGKGIAIGAVLVVVAGLCLVGALNGGDDDTRVPAPTATERADTVAVLKRSADSQGICYGWRLQDSSTVVSVGSNLGDGVDLRADPRCPRWVEVVADVTYTSESSELEDSAYVRVQGSDDIDSLDLVSVQSGLARFGLTDDTFIDDPGWAVTRAAVALPLLVAEQGTVSPAPVATATPATPPPALPDAGGDFWRDRWAYLLATAGLLLVTALLVTIGLVQRRRQRRPAAPEQRTAGTAPADGQAADAVVTPVTRRTRRRP